MTKHLKCDVLLYYKFIIQFGGERIFKTGEDLAKLRKKWLIFHAPHSPCAFSSKKQNSPDK